MTKDIFVVDAETFEIAGHIAVGDYTDDVIGSRDGKVAFGNAQIWAGNPLSWQANEAGRIFALDTATDPRHRIYKTRPNRCCTRRISPLCLKTRTI